MTTEQIDELLGRMKKEGHYFASSNGFTYAVATVRNILQTLSEYADTTLKPLPDPCEVAFKEDFNHSSFASATENETHRAAYRAGWNAAMSYVEPEYFYFTCPKCGGHYFGRDTGMANGQPAPQETVHCNDQHQTGCKWWGVWPVKGEGDER